MEDLYLVLAKLDPELGTAQPQLVDTVINDCRKKSFQLNEHMLNFTLALDTYNKRKKNKLRLSCAKLSQN